MLQPANLGLAGIILQCKLKNSGVVQMLIVLVHNDGTGTKEIANYKYEAGSIMM